MTSRKDQAQYWVGPSGGSGIAGGPRYVPVEEIAAAFGKSEVGQKSAASVTRALDTSVQVRM